MIGIGERERERQKLAVGARPRPALCCRLCAADTLPQTVCGELSAADCLRCINSLPSELLRAADWELRAADCEF